MPTVTINIAGSGTQLATGETSSTGHMWYSLDDGDGNTSSYGFAPDPAHEGWPLAPGEVHRNDDTNYQGRDTSVTIPISQAQYDAMKNFGENPGADGFSTFYNGLANSCIDFTWAALEKAGLNPSGFEGFFWPTWNGIAVPTINMDSIRNMFQTATVQPSPLILDLDGDGVETTPVNADAYFDHAGDGFAEQTGWVGADDGLLVYDRNANGTIDTGAELFGDNTLLAD
ncbi:MAG: hypothetical protein HY885_04010, partial [Deltaproteobacteria bacterium]|nr:hypothetical protein [Deltaproteobacteria bacterium]